jgi:hypothetical protein
MDENILDEEPEFRDVLEEAIASLVQSDSRTLH